MQICWWQLSSCIVTPCGCGQCYWHFGGKCCLHIQSQSVQGVWVSVYIQVRVSKNHVGKSGGWCLAWATRDNGLEHRFPTVFWCTLWSLEGLMFSLHNFLSPLSLLTQMDHQPLLSSPLVFQNINQYIHRKSPTLHILTLKTLTTSPHWTTQKVNWPKQLTIMKA
jgi:hypothetical protein